MIIERFVSTGGFLNRYEINILPIKTVRQLILTKHHSLNLKKKVKFKVPITEMYPRILWEQLADHLRSAEHTLGIKGQMIWRYWRKWSNKKQKTQSAGYWRSEYKRQSYSSAWWQFWVSLTLHRSCLIFNIQQLIVHIYKRTSCFMKTVSKMG